MSGVHGAPGQHLPEVGRVFGARQVLGCPRVSTKQRKHTWSGRPLAPLVRAGAENTEAAGSIPAWATGLRLPEKHTRRDASARARSFRTVAASPFPAAPGARASPCACAGPQMARRAPWPGGLRASSGPGETDHAARWDGRRALLLCPRGSQSTEARSPRSPPLPPSALGLERRAGCVRAGRGLARPPSACRTGAPLGARAASLAEASRWSASSRLGERGRAL